MSSGFKERKITVKPYLNKRVEPKPYKVYDEYGHEVEHFGYPLYYQVIYNKNNTHLKSDTGKRFSSLDEPFFENGDPKEIIGFETRNIEKIIRYHESKELNYHVKGLSKIFSEYTESLHAIVNFKLKKFIVNKFGLATNQLYFSLFDYKSTNISSNFVFSVIKKLRDVKTIFTKEEIDKIENLKNFDFAYIKDRGIGSGDQYNLERDNVLYVPGFSDKFPTKIDWLNGDIQNQIKRIIFNNKELKKIDPNKLIKHITWIMELLQAMKP